VWALWTLLAMLLLLSIPALVYPRSSLFSWSVWRVLFKVKPRIRKLALARGMKVRLRCIGAVALSPNNLAIWIATRSDTERDGLIGDLTFRSECREVLARCGYPLDGIPFVGLEIQSQQTVDRKSGCSWFMAMK
jgi:hypothetical protein